MSEPNCRQEGDHKIEPDPLASFSLSLVINLSLLLILLSQHTRFVNIPEGCVFIPDGTDILKKLLEFDGTT